MTTQGLAISDVVNVTVTIAAMASGYQNFGSMLIVGSSAVVDTFERIRQYSNIEEVSTDFDNTTPEWKAANLFFSQNPRPSLLYIGRWAQAAAAGVLHGAVLSAEQAEILNFTTAPTNSGLYLRVDDVPVSAAGCNMQNALNMNAVAYALQTAIGGAATVVWNDNYNRFDVTSATTGAASSVSYAQAPTAWNWANFAGQPAPNDTLTVNGSTAFVFTDADPANAFQVKIGTDLAATMASLAAAINASADVNITGLIECWVKGSKLYFEAQNPGTGGNSYTLAKSSSNITLKATNFAGGTGTDCSTLFGLTLAMNATPPVVGIDAETLLTAVEELADVSSAWYGVGIATSPMPSDNDLIAVSQFVESTQRAHIHAVTTQNPLVMTSGYSLDIMSRLKALGCMRTFCQYSSSNAYAAISAFARAFTVDFEGINTTITLKFKQEPLVTPETIRESQAAAIKAKNGNVYVNYGTGSSTLTGNTGQQAIIQEAVMSNGYYMDEVHGLDWLQNRIQIDCWNLLRTSTTKVPQTDDGTHQLVTAVDKGCQQAVVNGMFAPGTWTGADVGNVKFGDTLPKGYKIYAPLVATQPQALREQRVSVPISVYGKFAGAIHFANVAVTVNR